MERTTRPPGRPAPIKLGAGRSKISTLFYNSISSAQRCRLTRSKEAMNVEEEVGRLREEILRLGQAQSDGSYKVTFGVLFNDDRCANIFEALVGTLRAAKKRKIVSYDGELLLQGVHDNVEIILLPSATTTAAA